MATVNPPNQNINGWLFVDKPSGMTSSAVVGMIKKQLKVKKVGHGGTLDPLASGVLPIAINEATKTADYVLNADKAYSFTIQFGANTDTLDKEGKVVARCDLFPRQEEVQRVIDMFVGEIEQIPPKYSAIKINGKRAYELARQGKDFNIQPRKIMIYGIAILEYNYKARQISFYTNVSKGTYIRTLAQDIATKLNTCGYVEVLRRESVLGSKKTLLISGNVLYNIGSCIGEYLVSLEDMLDDISAYSLNTQEATKLLNGNVSNLIPRQDLKAGVLKALYNDKIIALLEYKDNCFKILRVFNTNAI